jgi:hypothetical protein
MSSHLIDAREELGSPHLTKERPLLVHHVAQRLRISLSAVRWNARRGYLQGFRDPHTPKLWRFLPLAVEAFRERKSHVL